MITRTVVAAAVAIGLSSVAAANDRALIIQSCQANLGLSTSGCNCVADRAYEVFNDREFPFFMAVITADQAAQTAAMQNLTVGELTDIGNKMNEIPPACAG